MDELCENYPNSRLHILPHIEVLLAAGLISVEQRGGCRLTLTHQAIGNIAEETCTGVNAGWGKLIGQCLTSYLLRAA